ncbi:MAG: sulfatase [Sedimentisphaerales bacterium]|nr:sulfatase [Sedimentisphaerales bacterium]
MIARMNRREFIALAGAGAVSLGISGCAAPNRTGAENKPANKPNFVVIFCDDLGYGDLGVYGHPTIRTPNIDAMAAQGQKWTNFYAAASVCTPSRAGLLTGRLPIRSGMCSSSRRVLFPDSAGGLPETEVTIAQALKPRGYATGCIGKWHLGHLPQYLPTRRGFDSYFGIPYSNDMKPTPLMQDEKTIEEPADQTTLTKRYTENAIAFIEKNKKKPFFLYFAHTFPHVPLFASKDFKGKSIRGIYGDAVEELDWSVGQILETLRRRNLAENTLVLFTSDNGPWLTQHLNGGSAGLLREGKGCTFDGGMREPFIAWWPGRIEPGQTIRDMGSTLDFLPTILSLAGAQLPTQNVLDGLDISPALLGTGPSPRKVMFFYRGAKLYAVRKGWYKAHYITKPAYGPGNEKEHDPPALYHLGRDPSEQYNVADKHSDIIADIRKEVALHLANLTPGKDQLAQRIPKKK